MSRPAAALNRFFIHEHYSIYYQRVKKLSWDATVRPEYLVLFILSGQLNFQSETRQGKLAKGDALLIGPSRQLNATGKELESVLLALAPSFLLDCAMRMRLVGPQANVTFASEIVTDKKLADFVRTLASEMTDEDAGREMMLASLTEQITVHLLRNHASMRRSDELELSRVGLIDRRIRRAVELMHAQLDRELSLKEIADASHLSPFHFSRLFKKLTGASPHAYLAQLRAKRAQQLLAETDYSVSEISARVGYATASHFTKAFRQATGLSPRAFRQALVSR